MLKNLSDLLGFTVMAPDGRIGKVVNFYYDDIEWRIRYLLADADSLPGKERVLIAYDAFSEPNWDEKVFELNLTREKIKNCPDIPRGEAVPREYEDALAHYYRWPLYWVSGERTPHPVTVTKHARTATSVEDIRTYQLQSFITTRGYTVEGPDGAIGALADMIIDDIVWDIRQLVVRCAGVDPARTILLAPGLVDSISPVSPVIKTHVLAQVEGV
jgi:hypothetical protein